MGETANAEADVGNTTGESARKRTRSASVRSVEQQPLGNVVVGESAEALPKGMCRPGFISRANSMISKWIIFQPALFSVLRPVVFVHALRYLFQAYKKQIWYLVRNVFVRPFGFFGGPKRCKIDRGNFPPPGMTLQLPKKLPKPYIFFIKNYIFPKRWHNSFKSIEICYSDTAAT